MQNDEQAIRELVATWIRASKAGDTPTVLGLMAEDVVFLVPGHPPMRGRDAFAALHRARSLLRRELDASLGVSDEGVYAFGGHRCDRIVAAVLARISALPDTGSPGDPPGGSAR